MDYKTADRLIELRKRNGYSQEELADRLSVSRQAVSKWERAESLPDTENLIALARLYNITLDEVVNGDKPVAAGGVTGNGAHIFTLQVDRKKARKIISAVFLGLGVLFVLIGTGFFGGFTGPEIRDQKIARNTGIDILSAEVTASERTSSSVGNETMYKIVFEWPDGSGKSNAVYSSDEAEKMIGKTVLIRAQGGRAVMVDYKQSALSVLGFIFIGIFGGLGVIFLSVSAVLYALNKRQKS